MSLLGGGFESNDNVGQCLGHMLRHESTHCGVKTERLGDEKHRSTTFVRLHLRRIVNVVVADNSTSLLVYQEANGFVSSPWRSEGPLGGAYLTYKDCAMPR